MRWTASSARRWRWAPLQGSFVPTVSVHLAEHNLSAPSASSARGWRWVLVQGAAVLALSANTAEDNLSAPYGWRVLAELQRRVIRLR